MKPANPKIQLSNDSWVRHLVGQFELSGDEFEVLWDEHPRHRDSMMMYGREVTLPRYQALYGNDVSYRFSGSTLKSSPLNHPLLIQAMQFVNDREPAFDYNGILVNWYRDGADYVGPHADDERDLLQDAPIYSFSFGASRIFRFIHNETQQKTDLLLEHGDVLIMGGKTQREFKHALPKALRVKDRRINLTVRAFHSAG